MSFLKVTRQATSRPIPVTDQKKAPQTTPHSEEMVEFMIGEYINRGKLKTLLDELFPGKWSARVVRGHLPLGFDN